MTDKKIIVQKIRIREEIEGYLVADIERGVIIPFNLVDLFVYNLCVSCNTFYEVIDRSKQFDQSLIFDSLNYLGYHRLINWIPTILAPPDMTSRSIYHYRAPVFVRWEITDQCNLHCLHCYRNCSKETGAHINFDIASMVIKDLSKAKVMTLAITGGEPMLHPLLIKIIQHAKDSGIPFVGLETNGMLLNRANASILANLLFFIQLSVYGGKSNSHDRITQEKGSFTKLIELMELLLSFGIHTSFNYVFHSENLEEIPMFLRMIPKDIIAVKLTPLDPIGRGKSLSFLVSPKNIKHVMDNMNIYRNIFPNVGMHLPYLKPEQELLINSCHAGTVNCHINRALNIYPCEKLPITVGNLRKNSISEIWSSSIKLHDIRQAQMDASKECVGCNSFSFCRGGCRANAYRKRKNILDLDMDCPTRIGCERA